MKNLRLPIAALVAATLLYGCGQDTVVEDELSLLEMESFDQNILSQIGEGPVQDYADHYLVEFSGDAASVEAAVRSVGGTVASILPEMGMATVTNLGDKEARDLGRNRAIQHVSRDLMVQWTPTKEESFFQMLDEVVIDQETGMLDPTSANFFSCQYGLDQIDVVEAWGTGALGSKSVKVAVLDTGIDPTHQDLVGKIDLVHTTSVLTSSPCGPQDINTILDYDFHGTFVSSHITSNNIGVAGVAPKTEVVSVKVMNCNGSGSFADIISGIYYAANIEDVKIINLSLGATLPKNLRGAGRLNAAMNKIVNYATSQGKLVISSAGNSALDMDRKGNLVVVPAESGTSVSIYATNINDELASYSNYGVSGTWVGGPGGDGGDDINLGCFLPPAFHSFTLGALSSYAGGSPTSYSAAAGTSFSAPVVAGVAALMMAENPGMTPAQVKTKLAQTAEDLGQPGRDRIYSNGRVNAFRAVSE